MFVTEDLSGVPGQSDRVRALIERIMKHAEELLPKIEDVQAEQMGDLVDKEMQQTSEAIEKAAEKIAVSGFFLLPLVFLGVFSFLYL